MNITKELIIYGANLAQPFYYVDNVCLRNEIDGTVSIQFQAHDNITLDKPENLSITGVEIWSQSEHTSSLRQDIYTLSNARIAYDQTLQGSYRDSYNTFDITISGILVKGETRDYSKEEKEEKGEEDVGNKVKRTFVKVEFPDARFRFTGNDYVYELPAGTASCNIPKERDFIRIHKLKDLHGKEAYCPAYSEKDLLVTESITFESEDDIDAQVYFGIGTWKVIQQWEISKRFEDLEKAPAPDLSNLLDGGAVFERETETIHNLEEECLKNAEPLTSLVNYKIKLEDVHPVIPSTNDTFVKLGETSGGTLNFGNDMKMVFENGSLFLIKNSGETEKVLTEKVEEKNMNKNMFSGIMKNFQFGKVDTDKIAYSMNGMAFKNQNGDYVVYNADGTATNVSTLAFQMPLFAMPTALANIVAGDVIVHNKENEYVVVKEVTKTAIVAIAPDRNEIVTIVPEQSIFGFAYYTKIISPMTMFNNQASESNPFGNMLPFMLMGDSDFDSKDAMLMMMMCGGAQNQNQNMMLPMMLMANKDSGSDMTVFMMAMMMNGNNSFAQNNIQE